MSLIHWICWSKSLLKNQWINLDQVQILKAHLQEPNCLQTDLTMNQTIPFNSETSMRIRSRKKSEFRLHDRNHLFDHFFCPNMRNMFFQDNVLILAEICKLYNKICKISNIWNQEQKCRICTPHFDNGRGGGGSGAPRATTVRPRAGRRQALGAGEPRPGRAPSPPATSGTLPPPISGFYPISGHPMTHRRHRVMCPDIGLFFWHNIGTFWMWPDIGSQCWVLHTRYQVIMSPIS